MNQNLNCQDITGIIPYHASERVLGHSLYSDFPTSDISQTKINWTDIFIRNNKGTEEDEINHYGFRCDDFTNKHDGKHILFMGCSCTWGTGLLIEEVWSKKTFSKISENEKVSGFFNLAIPGNSIFTQVANAFKYFKYFGNPDVIFFNIPDLERFYGFSKEKNDIVSILLEPNNDSILGVLSYQYYYMLTQYCNSHNIKLLSFSWTESYTLPQHFNSLSKSKITEFDNFYTTSLDEAFTYIENLKSQYDEEDALVFARDGNHPGIAYNEYWSDFMYKKYLEIL